MAQPLLYFDVIEGRNPSEIKTLLDTTDAAMVEAFGVPKRDRYQVVNTTPLATPRLARAHPPVRAVGQPNDQEAHRPTPSDPRFHNRA